MTALATALSPTYVVQIGDVAHYGFEVEHEDGSEKAFIFFARDDYAGEWQEVMRLTPHAMNFLMRAVLQEVWLA